MSQTKDILETINIPLDQIKPSPYQPRLTFNLEDIRGSIQRDGILVPLTVRKKDRYYELIDGERRVRLAKELGYKTVPCTIIDVDDETARRMVWKVNTLRQEYTPKEKAYHFKKLQEEYGMSLRGIARECDYSDTLVRAYLAIFRLPEEYREYVWLGKIGVGHLVQLLNAGFFNRDAKTFAQAIAFLDQIIDQRLSDREFKEMLEPTLREYQKRRVESAKKAVGEVVPEVREPETPEELEEAAEALRREAKRRKTPEQRRQELIYKIQASLNSFPSLDDAEKLGINTSPYKFIVRARKSLSRHNSIFNSSSNCHASILVHINGCNETLIVINFLPVVFNFTRPTSHISIAT